MDTYEPFVPAAPGGRRRAADTSDRVARDWVEAWSRGNLDGVRGLLAEDVTVECNLGWPSERTALIDTLHRLAGQLEQVTLLSLTAAADRAALLYDCRTRQPAGSIRLAEFLDVRGDHIAGVRRVYDLTAIDALVSDLRRPPHPAHG